MGYVKHDAIVVTSWKQRNIIAAWAKACDLGLQCTCPLESSVNGYYTFFVCPDGSQEEWPESNRGDEQRAAFVAYLNGFRCKDNSSRFEWACLSYGHDPGAAVICASAWDTTLSDITRAIALLEAFCYTVTPPQG